MATTDTITLTNVLFGEKSFEATEAQCVDSVTLDALIDGHQNISVEDTGEVLLIGVDSSSATQGQVLTANGDGESSWQGFAAGITFDDTNEGEIVISGVSDNG